MKPSYVELETELATVTAHRDLLIEAIRKVCVAGKIIVDDAPINGPQALQFAEDLRADLAGEHS